MSAFVQLATLAEHIGKSVYTVRRRIKDGSIPRSALAGNGAGLRVHLEQAVAALTSRYAGESRAMASSVEIRDLVTREGPATDPVPRKTNPPDSKSNPNKSKIPSEKPSSPESHPGLVDALRCAHAAKVKHLLLVTLTAPTISEARFEAALAEFAQFLPCWGIWGRNRTGDGERHAHLIVATDEDLTIPNPFSDVKSEKLLPSTLVAAIGDWTEVGALPELQHVTLVTGWEHFALCGDDTLLQPNLFNIIRYLGCHDVRRVVRTGIFAACVADGDPEPPAPQPRPTIVRVERFPESLSDQLGSEPPPRPAPQLRVGSARPGPRSNQTRSEGQPKTRNRAPERNRHMTDPPHLALDEGFLDSGVYDAPPLAPEQAAREPFDAPEHAPIPNPTAPQSSSEPGTRSNTQPEAT